MFATSCRAAMLAGFALLFAGGVEAQSLTLAPTGYVTVGVGGTVQFTATASGFTIAAMKWEVANVQGGSASTGTITTGLTGGLYTAPASVPQNSEPILLVVTDTNGNKYSASGSVTVMPPPPVITSVSPGPLPVGTDTVTILGSGFQANAMVYDSFGGQSMIQYAPISVSPGSITVSIYQGAATSSTFCVKNAGTACSNSITVAVGSAGGSSGGSSSGGSGSSSGNGSSGGSGSSGVPVLTMVGPSPLPVGTEQITLSGSGFQAGALVYQSYGSQSMIQYAADQVSAGAVLATIYQGTATTATFCVKNPGTACSNSITVSVGSSSSMPSSGGSGAAPVLTSVGPSPLSVGTVQVTILGSGFLSGALVYDSFGNQSMIQYPADSVTAGTVLATIYQGSAPTSTFCVKNPGSACSNSITVNVNTGPPPPQAIAPTTASLNLGATQQFNSAGATAFTATAGTITSGGFYTAPAVMPASATVTITATGPGGNATATVTLINPNPQLIAPAALTLNVGGTQQFLSAGATNWTALNGTITSAGFYTAPAVWPASGTDTVTVTGPNGTATAAITITPPTPVVSAVGTNNQLPLGVFAATVAGTGFTAQSTVTLGGTPLTATFAGGSINITGFYGQSGQANLVVTNASISSQPFTVQVGVPNALVSVAAARRFLQQAGFGPTPADAAHVQAIGFQAWLNEQFAMTPVSNYQDVAGQSQGGMPASFLANAVTNPDQLRQKVAFALSQIFVTSLTKVLWNDVMIPYQEMLLNDAFTNYTQILTDVTLSPCMGYYLDMANNEKADPVLGTSANENYAREVMQLMSIGTKVLNQDGTWPLDVNGLPIALYGEPDIQNMARIFTGWTYAAGSASQPPIFGAYINPSAPMVPFGSEHDTGAKTVMSYSAPAGLSPQDDLNGVLGYLAAHPNTAPFISKQLIERMVKSNPTPQYVQRVAAAFTQSKGDMPTVITAILLDPEARANDEGGNDLPTDGHLQEPALLIAGVVRAFGGQMTDQNWYSSVMASMGQDIFNPASVFNYDSPSFVVGGTGGLLGPEFQLDNPNASILRENFVANLTNSYSNPMLSNGQGTTVDLTPFLALAGTPATLVSAVNMTLTEGTMPQGLQTIITNAVNGDQNGALHRVETAVYLTLVSNYYNVWH